METTSNVQDVFKKLKIEKAEDLKDLEKNSFNVLNFSDIEILSKDDNCR